MEKILEVMKDASNDERISFKDEFAKAQKKILEKAPTPEHFMNLIDQLKDISEEEKEKLKKNLLERAEKFKILFTEKQSLESPYRDYIVFITMVALIACVIGEISYRFCTGQGCVSPPIKAAMMWNYRAWGDFLGEYISWKPG